MNQRQLGMYFLNQGACTRARDHLCAWVKSHPEDLAAHMELVWCFKMQVTPHFNKWGNCNNFYQEIASKQKDSGLIRFVRAEQLVYDSREEEALDEYRTALNEGLDAAVVRYRVGYALQKLQKRNDALAEYTKACEMDPLFVPAVYAHACLLYVDGRLDYLERVAAPLSRVDFVALDLMHRDGASDARRIMNMSRAAHAVRIAVGMIIQGAFKNAVLHLLPVWQDHKNTPWLIRTLAYLFYRSDWIPFAKTVFSNTIPEDNPASFYALGLVSWYDDAFDCALDPKQAYLECL